MEGKVIFSFQAVYDFIQHNRALFGGGVAVLVGLYLGRLRKDLQVANTKLRRNMNDGETAPIKTTISDIQTQVDISEAKAKELEDSLTRSLNNRDGNGGH